MLPIIISFMLEVKGLVVGYGRNRRVLNRVDLAVGGGEKVAVVGPNGSGKSTLIRAALGLVPITEGSVRVFGTNVISVSGELRVSTNLSEVYRLLNCSAAELMEVFAELKSVSPPNYLNLVDYFGLQDVLDKRVYEMSSGQAKMFGNIMALGSEPKLLLLDEPFENVDQSRRVKLANMLAGFDGGVVMVTHEFDLLRKFQDWKLYFMIEGTLYGAFSVRDLDELYISRGEKPGSILTVNTSFGTFSITRGQGDVALKNATSINRLIEEVA
jgi:ABC-type multidrug transport system ATPase subunit